MTGFQGARWRPPAPRFAAPKRSGKRTLPPLTFLPLPGPGPEHVAVDTQGRVLAGLADGQIVRVGPAGATETVANTGGRPLGMEFADEDTLIVCDAERGLLRVTLAASPTAGPAASPTASPAASPTAAPAVDVLCDQVNGERLVFCSCPAVASDGTVYFSQSSRRYDLAHFMGDLLEHSGTGRVMRWRDGQVDVIADGFHFANGVVLAPDESSLAVAETGAYRITRVALTGERAGQTSDLIDALPGFPDNLTTGPDGLIWVGMASSRDLALDFLLPRPPWLRAAMWALPERLLPGPKNLAWVIAVDQDGRVVHDLHGWKAGFREVTAARVHDGQLYLASINEPALARADLPA